MAFNNDRSYMKAVSAGFIEIKANKFNKKVQVDPYLDDHLCSQCQQVQGQYFCREVMCFTYYCLPCWNWHHSIEAYKPHVPLTRNSKVSILTITQQTPFCYNQSPENLRKKVYSGYLNEIISILRKTITTILTISE